MGVLLGAGLLLLFIHCTSAVQPSAEALYRGIEKQFVQGNLAEAERESSFVDGLSRKPGEIDSRWLTKFRLQRAKIWFWQGHSEETLSLLAPPFPPSTSDQALAASRSSLLALAYDRTGDLIRARKALAEAESQCRGDLCMGDVHLAQGVIDGQNGRFAKAEQALRSSLTIARNANNRFLETQALIDLGVAAERQEHYDDALDRFGQASKLAGSIDARLLLEKAAGSEGWAFYKLGDYPHALFNSQLAEREASSLGVLIDQVRWLNNAGLCQYRLGDFSAARSSYQRSYKLAQSLRNDEEMGDTLLALAYLSLETGDLDDALAKASEVQKIAAQRGDPDDALEPSLIEAVALGRQGHRLTAKTKLLALEQHMTAGESVRWETENALARLSLDDGDNATADNWFRRAIATFRLQRSSLNNVESRLPFFENGSKLYLDYMEQLIREGKTDAALAVLDQSRAETLAEGLGIAPEHSTRGRREADTIGNANALARRAGGTILVYCLRPQTSYLWAIGPRRSGFFRLPGRETIQPLVAAHAQQILSSKDILAQQDSPGQALYRDLVEPAGALLAPHGKVFVIADEGLNALNFETLIAPGQHFWIEDADIINARSISLLAASRPQPPPRQNARRLLLVGDPVYDRQGEVKLPHASEEVARVAEHFAPQRRLVLTGAQATPDAYQRSHPESFAYIHFVAHASASEINPLDSSVILSPAPDAQQTYKLYARSILDQRLSADLVTISACYGSGVRSYSGEGLIGLAWAFLHTGSHHVIGTLWEVSDISTPQLMGDLYDGLARGNRPDVALRSAKLAMIHGGGVFRKPFYWAAFQLYSGA
jgi:CHAT domain-containing protein/tetratricopeptide (TPR) repeat protein